MPSSSSATPSRKRRISLKSLFKSSSKADPPPPLPLLPSSSPPPPPPAATAPQQPPLHLTRHPPKQQQQQTRQSDSLTIPSSSKSSCDLSSHSHSSSSASSSSFSCSPSLVFTPSSTSSPWDPTATKSATSASIESTSSTASTNTTASQSTTASSSDRPKEKEHRQYSLPFPSSYSPAPLSCSSVASASASASATSYPYSNSHPRKLRLLNDPVSLTPEAPRKSTDPTRTARGSGRATADGYDGSLEVHEEELADTSDVTVRQIQREGGGAGQDEGQSGGTVGEDLDLADGVSDDGDTYGEPSVDLSHTTVQVLSQATPFSQSTAALEEFHGGSGKPITLAPPKLPESGKSTSTPSFATQFEKKAAVEDEEAAQPLSNRLSTLSVTESVYHSAATSPTSPTFTTPPVAFSNTRAATSTTTTPPAHLLNLPRDSGTPARASSPLPPSSCATPKRPAYSQPSSPRALSFGAKICVEMTIAKLIAESPAKIPENGPPTAGTTTSGPEPTNNSNSRPELPIYPGSVRKHHEIDDLGHAGVGRLSIALARTQVLRKLDERRLTLLEEVELESLVASSYATGTRGPSNGSLKSSAAIANAGKLAPKSPSLAAVAKDNLQTVASEHLAAPDAARPATPSPSSTTTDISPPSAPQRLDLIHAQMPHWRLWVSRAHFTRRKVIYVATSAGVREERMLHDDDAEKIVLSGRAKCLAGLMRIPDVYVGRTVLQEGVRHHPLPPGASHYRRHSSGEHLGSGHQQFTQQKKNDRQMSLNLSTEAKFVKAQQPPTLPRLTIPTGSRPISQLARSPSSQQVHFDLGSGSGNGGLDAGHKGGTGGAGERSLSKSDRRLSTPVSMTPSSASRPTATPIQPEGPSAGKVIRSGSSFFKNLFSSSAANRISVSVDEKAYHSSKVPTAIGGPSKSILKQPASHHSAVDGLPSSPRPQREERPTRPLSLVFDAGRYPREPLINFAGTYDPNLLRPRPAPQSPRDGHDGHSSPPRSPVEAAAATASSLPSPATKDEEDELPLAHLHNKARAGGAKASKDVLQVPSSAIAIATTTVPGAGPHHSDTPPRAHLTMRSPTATENPATPVPRRRAISDHSTSSVGNRISLLAPEAPLPHNASELAALQAEIQALRSAQTKAVEPEKEIQRLRAAELTRAKEERLRATIRDEEAKKAKDEEEAKKKREERKRWEDHRRRSVMLEEQEKQKEQQRKDEKRRSSMLPPSSPSDNLLTRPLSHPLPSHNQPPRDLLQEERRRQSMLLPPSVNAQHNLLPSSQSVPQLFQPQPIQPAPYVHPDFLAYQNQHYQQQQQQYYGGYPSAMMASSHSMPFLGLPVVYPASFTPPLTPPRYESPTSTSSSGGSPIRRPLDSPDLPHQHYQQQQHKMHSNQDIGPQGATVQPFTDSRPVRPKRMSSMPTPAQQATLLANLSHSPMQHHESVQPKMQSKHQPGFAQHGLIQNATSPHQAAENQQAHRHGRSNGDRRSVSFHQDLAAFTGSSIANASSKQASGMVTALSVSPPSHHLNHLPPPPLPRSHSVDPRSAQRGSRAFLEGSSSNNNSQHPSTARTMKVTSDHRASWHHA